MQYEMTRITTGRASVSDVGPELLRTICEPFGWEAGELWLVDAQQSVLRRHSAWYAAHLPSQARATLAATLTLARGEGLPGHIWRACEIART